MGERDADVSISEFCRARTRLRQLMLKAHAECRFADALAEALTSLDLAKAFYTRRTGHGLTGDMVIRENSCSKVNRWPWLAVFVL